MLAFAHAYRKYLDAAGKGPHAFGLDPDRIAQLAPLLAFLYEDWWRVTLKGLDLLPQEGPALIVSNTGGVIPWPALMLTYAFMSSKDQPRRLNVLANLDWIEDERLHSLLSEIGFVPWSSNNAKKLFAAGETVLVFPEGVTGMTKPYSERNRLADFDWIRLLPAIEEGIPVYPMAVLGCDESIPVLANFKGLARLLHLPAFPITATFPWLPFPINMVPLPVKWNMGILKNMPYKPQDRQHAEDEARRVARCLEGEIQAELNRLIRSRIKAIF